MRIWTPLVVGASFCALMACGTDSDDDGGGFSSSLPADTPADSLTDEQKVQLCEDYANYVRASISANDIARIDCTIEALFEAEAETPEECNQYVSQCVANNTDAEDPAEDIDCSDPDEFGLDDCSAPIGEVEACLNARLSQIRSVSSQVNCNNPEGIMALFGGMDEPGQCTAIADECPGLADGDDGGGGGDGGNTDPIDRSDCITIGSGEVTAELTDDDPRYDNAHADIYCITLAAGNTLTATTSAPDGSGSLDTIISVLDPSDNEIASDDDGGDGVFSSLTVTISEDGEHAIVVHGFSSGDTGDYVLTVSQE